MSYTDKNDNASQIEFLDSILPLYGIKNLADYESEIDSKTLASKPDFLPKINEKIPQIKKLFKVSTMGLSRKNFIIDSEGFAIAILKHMCRQARILFDLTKYKTKMTFALTPDNLLLKKYIEEKYSNDFRSVRVELPKPVTMEELLEIPRVLHKQTLWSPGGFPWKDNTDHDMLPDFLNSADMTNVFLNLIVNTKSSCQTRGVLVGKNLNVCKINDNPEGETVSIFFPIGRTFDVMLSLNSICIYDEKNLKLIPVAINLCVRKEPVYENYTLKDPINLPVYSLPFSQVDIELVFERSFLENYKASQDLRVVCDCNVLFLQDKIRRSRHPQNWREYSISAGCLSIEERKDYYEEEYLVKGNVFDFPECSYEIYDISCSSDTPPLLCFNALCVGKIDEKTFTEKNSLPPSSFTQKQLRFEENTEFVTVKYKWRRRVYREDIPKEMVINGKIYRFLNGTVGYSGINFTDLLPIE